MSPSLSRRWLCGVATLLAGLALGCPDEGEDGAPTTCTAEVDACADCPRGLFCRDAPGGGKECYLPCDTAEDCAECEDATYCTDPGDGMLVCGRL